MTKKSENIMVDNIMNAFTKGGFKPIGNCIYVPDKGTMVDCEIILDNDDRFSITVAKNHDVIWTDFTHTTVVGKVETLGSTLRKKVRSVVKS